MPQTEKGSRHRGIRKEGRKERKKEGYEGRVFRIPYA
jgi:hypothetical protein